MSAVKSYAVVLSYMSTQHPMSCSERQLVLWYQYDVAQRAAAQSLALQTQLGQKPADSQIAAALGLSAPFSLSACLAAGKVQMMLLPDNVI